MHPVEFGPYLARLRTDAIATVAAEAYEVITSEEDVISSLAPAAGRSGATSRLPAGTVMTGAGAVRACTLGDGPMDAFPWHQGQILTVVDGGDPTASPAVVMIHTGAGRFRMTCLPQRAIEAPLRARDVVIVRQVPPGGGLLVERCLRGASDGCWCVLGDITPVPGAA
jgi:hypothetical protein